MVMNNPIVEVDGLHRVFTSFFYSAFKILKSQDKKKEKQMEKLEAGTVLLLFATLSKCYL